MSSKITLIIPAYNIAPWISRCLDSVLSQTYHNLEIIVINDGSTDGTDKVADSYSSIDSRIHVIHQHNCGTTSTRIRGISESSGDWIGFVDGDDFVEPEMFEHLLKNALKYDADISHCGYQMVFPDGHIDYYYNTGRIVQQSKTEGLKNLISGSFIEPGLWNKLYRRELFSDILKNGIDTSISINEDFLMNYYLFKNSNHSVFEDICPYHYILRRNSASTASINEHKLLDPIRATKTIYEDADDTISSDVLLRLVRQLIYLSTISAKASPELILPHRRNARRELRTRQSEIWHCSELSFKIKVMSAWAAYLPSTYALVHSVYSQITGLDKKYKID